MSNSTVFYPQPAATGDGSGVVSHAGLLLVTRTAEVAGLPDVLRESLAPWRKDYAVHDPGKIVLDLVVAMISGGDCVTDLAILRGRESVFGQVASDPTVSRLISTLAAEPVTALSAIAKARAAARGTVWELAGEHAPSHDIGEDSPLIIDLDATLLTAHSEKQDAAPTYKKGYGFHPLVAFIDHGAGGTGEAGTGLLRPGNAGANTAADHTAVLRATLNQIPGLGWRAGRKILVRTDSAGGTKEFLNYMHKRCLSYSCGFPITPAMAAAIDTLPKAAWTQAYNADGQPREGADVAELTGLLDLDGYPGGMRVIVRREKPHHGAQLRFTDVNGWRLTCFVTNARRGQLADLEVRHRRRARCEDRIRAAKATGMTNLPFHDFAKNQIWLALVELAADLTAWTQMLALPGTDARTWEIKRLRLRLWAAAARLARHARTRRLRYDQHHQWTPVLIAGLHRLDGYRASG
ncbi:putative transposase [Gordonia hirsuta DSM 44140 = NBRC 16056]|uniref:Putative transposase n=1 Tax=Gordonia hirsuta DSM 44140 = NBRC 16056 TaxID=1121927 RepID=L7LDS8_9ACTN|nr:IS1380 family transposase [Gordonia hirsuta]GAC59034.1 putative transposase [Gordonia hirsuta DSM 44140 = NBRC 16056]